MRKGRAAKLVLSVVLVLVGTGFFLYPKASDVRYAIHQGILEAQAVEVGESGVALPADSVAKLIIPAIDLESYVQDGTGRDVLDVALGHYEDTVLPGEYGNCGIAGHRTMYGHPFRNLDKLSNGDEVITYTRSKKAVYRVVETRIVDPSETDVVAPVDGARLTLTTCHPVGSARQRLVVIAELAQ